MSGTEVPCSLFGASESSNFLTATRAFGSGLLLKLAAELAFRNRLSAAEFTPTNSRIQTKSHLRLTNPLPGQSVLRQLRYVGAHRLPQGIEVITAFETRNNPTVTDLPGPLLDRARQ